MSKGLGPWRPRESNQFLHWGQVGVSRVILGQPVKGGEERGFRKSPALPPACLPPSPSGWLQGAAEGRMYQTERRKNPCQPAPLTLDSEQQRSGAARAADQQRPGWEANPTLPKLFSLAEKKGGPGFISKERGARLWQ